MKDIKGKSFGMCVALVSMLLSLSLANFASADNSSSSMSSPAIPREKIFIQKKDKNEIKERLNDKKEEIKEGIENKRENEDDFEDKFDDRHSKINAVALGTSTASTSQLKGKIAEKIKKQNKKIIEKLNKDVKKLKSLYEKISSKISKFEKKGVSVTEARTLLGIAKLKIEAVESGLDDIVAKPTVKISVAKARDLIKSAKESLADVVKALKPGLNKSENSSSSSVSSSGVSSTSSSVI